MHTTALLSGDFLGEGILAASFASTGELSDISWKK